MELKSRSLTARTLQSIDNENILRVLNHPELLSFLFTSVQSFAKYLDSS
jgi:hypothetical protein